MKDSMARITALDPTQSFIVQAPAGSGKTELLTQRFLKLLATVKSPEQILAVTFTRKAAAEMRHRILKSLKEAHQDKQAQNDHERYTLDLAKTVLLRDQKNNWCLLKNPNRLNIVTIDSLCAMLTGKLPVLSQMGVSPTMSDYPRILYTTAVQNLLIKTDSNDRWYPALSQLLLHQDNRITLIIELLVNLLQKRDQWLNYIGEIKFRGIEVTQMLNEAISRTLISHLKLLKSAFAEHDCQGLLYIARSAGQNILKNDKDSLIKHCAYLEAMPRNTLDDLPLWQGIAELLLTQKGELRKTVTQNQGFLSPSETKDKQAQQDRKALKETYKDIQLEFADDQHLIDLLAELAFLPPMQLPNEQKQILTALFEVLPVLVAFLQLEFQEKGQIDFIELNLRAQAALSEDNPTDIQLILDHQLQHILIDEYQDTSYAQYRLFEKLVAGWQPGEGRTLFMVGDPMQSIYRFRGAEVSLFLYTQLNGLGPIRLRALTLLNNFRSNQALIEWINDRCAKMFPLQANMTLGAVTYSPALAAKPRLEEPAVIVQHCLLSQQEKTLVAQLRQVMKEHVNDAIAILVRTRKHLDRLIPLLKQQSIPFVAYEVEQLSQRPHIQDLMALLKAVTNLTDIVAWFAILRAPWLGLSLQDLLVFSKRNEHILWQTIENYQQYPDLSAQGKAKLDRFVPIIQHFLHHFGRKRISEYLHALWLILGGPSCYKQAHFLDDIQSFVALVRQQEKGGIIEDVHLLEQALDNLYTDIQPQLVNTDPIKPIEIMTIHKSKGLEFDHVFIPHLQAKPANTQQEWFAWLERTDAEDIDLLLAAKAQRNEYCDYYQYVQRQISKKNEFELTRVLYVALTRARKHLYLFSELAADEKPRKGSFLHLLWDGEGQASQTQEELHIEPIRMKTSLDRLKPAWQLPKLIQLQFEHHKRELDALTQTIPAKTDFEAKIRGTVFHRILQWHSVALFENKIEIDVIKNQCRLAMLRAGMPESALNVSIDIVTTALDKMRVCAKGRWILDPNHDDKRNEWSLTEKDQFGISEHIIDYTFIDKGMRWIIDYKLSPITEANVPAHQDEIHQYLAQLIKYQRVVSKLEARDIHCALYFPLTQFFLPLAKASMSLASEEL
jgi:ATP-dependent helicase/nuclease subunit A